MKSGKEGGADPLRPSGMGGDSYRGPDRSFGRPEGGGYAVLHDFRTEHNHSPETKS